jgi:hypothetical protein
VWREADGRREPYGVCEPCFRYHHPVSVPDDAALVEAYLASLADAPAATRRQRSWALRDLLDHLEVAAEASAEASGEVAAGALTAPTGPAQSPAVTEDEAGRDLAGIPPGGRRHPRTTSSGALDVSGDAGDAGAALASPGRLSAFTGPARLPGALDPDAVAGWLFEAASGPRAASLPGLRARASAVRALATYAEEHRLASPGTLESLRPVLRLSTPIGPAPADSPRVRQLLALAHPDAGGHGVLAAVWTRFCAHTHLLALSGAREDVLAAVELDDVADGLLTLREPAQSGQWSLPAPAQRALQAWLASRAEVVRSLRGSEPTALWLRVRPSADRRTGALRPAGLPLSARGLRLAFTTTLAALEPRAPQLHGLGTHEVRGHAKFARPEPS